METDPRRPRFSIDANVIGAVGSVLEVRGYDVDHVTRAFGQGTLDLDIDLIARTEGSIILSHDRRFMKLTRQPRVNLNLVITAGYGRIMLCGPYAEQRKRLEQTIGQIELSLGWAWTRGQRLLISIGPSWIRYDDRPLRSKSR